MSGARDLVYLCREMKAPSMLAAVERLAERARTEVWSHEDFLAACLEKEVSSRQSHGGEARIASARFPARKTLEDFDFEHQRSVRKEVVAHLGALDFIEAKSNAVFLGPPGTGKSHLSIALGIRACPAGHRVAFATAAEWVDRLGAAHDAGKLQYELRRLGRYPLVIIDEVGYIPFQGEAANLFFQLVSSRYERASVIVSSNKAFSRWGEVFGDDTVAAAMIDRLVHHAEIVAAAGHARQGTDGWSAGRYWFGQTAMSLGEFDIALEHFTAVRDAIADREPSRALADCLAGCCVAQSNLGRLPAAIEDGLLALNVARQLNYSAGEALALTDLAIAAYYAGEIGDAVGWARQAQQIDQEAIPGGIARISGTIMALVLSAAGDLGAAERCCTDTLARCREAGDLQAEAAPLTLFSHLALDSGRLSAAAAHLRESLEIVTDRRADRAAELHRHLRPPVRHHGPLSRRPYPMGCARRSRGARRDTRSAGRRPPPPGAAAEGGRGARAGSGPRSGTARGGDDARHYRRVRRNAHR